jgi:hypothetical protein
VGGSQEKEPRRTKRLNSKPWVAETRRLPILEHTLLATTTAAEHADHVHTLPNDVG